MRAGRGWTRQDVMGAARALTWRGKVSVLYYAVRRLFVSPAPTEDRCVMGSPIGPWVWCPRRADGLWCRRHQPDPAQVERPSIEAMCCNGFDDVCVSSGCLLGIPGGERGLIDECDQEGCACHDQ